jgi:hypothetical protein
MFKANWAIDAVWSGEPRFAKPIRTRGAVFDQWELVAFGRRLYVSVRRR